MTEEQLKLLSKGKSLLESRNFYNSLISKHKEVIGKGGYQGWNIHLVDPKGISGCLPLSSEEFDDIIKLIISLFEKRVNKYQTEFNNLQL